MKSEQWIQHEKPKALAVYWTLNGIIRAIDVFTFYNTVKPIYIFVLTNVSFPESFHADFHLDRLI